MFIILIPFRIVKAKHFPRKGNARFRVVFFSSSYYTEAAMEKRNYQKELDEIILNNGTEKPTLLLHSCCGPCSSAVLEYLTQYFVVTLLWFNPNIYPDAEFEKRLQTQLQLLKAMGLENDVLVLQEPRRSEEWYAQITGLEKEPEGGARCTECFRLRLTETARIASEGGYDWFCTTLTLSRHKDAVRINELGEEIGEKYGVRWLPSDFKKRGREQRSQDLSREYGLYRQDYCGCEYSIRK